MGGTEEFIGTSSMNMKGELPSVLMGDHLELSEGTCSVDHSVKCLRGSGHSIIL